MSDEKIEDEVIVLKMLKRKIIETIDIIDSESEVSTISEFLQAKKTKKKKKHKAERNEDSLEAKSNVHKSNPKEGGNGEGFGKKKKDRINAEVEQMEEVILKKKKKKKKKKVIEEQELPKKKKTAKVKNSPSNSDSKLEGKVLEEKKKFEEKKKKRKKSNEHKSDPKKVGDGERLEKKKKDERKKIKAEVEHLEEAISKKKKNKATKEEEVPRKKKTAKVKKSLSNPDYKLDGEVFEGKKKFEEKTKKMEKSNEHKSDSKEVGDGERSEKKKKDGKKKIRVEVEHLEEAIPKKKNKKATEVEVLRKKKTAKVKTSSDADCKLDEKNSEEKKKFKEKAKKREKSNEHKSDPKEVANVERLEKKKKDKKRKIKVEVEHFEEAIPKKKMNKATEEEVPRKKKTEKSGDASSVVKCVFKENGLKKKKPSDKQMVEKNTIYDGRSQLKESEEQELPLADHFFQTPGTGTKTKTFVPDGSADPVMANSRSVLLDPPLNTGRSLKERGGATNSAKINEKNQHQISHSHGHHGSAQDDGDSQAKETFQQANGEASSQAGERIEGVKIPSLLSIKPVPPWKNFSNLAAQFRPQQPPFLFPYPPCLYPPRPYPPCPYPPFPYPPRTYPPPSTSHPLWNRHRQAAMKGHLTQSTSYTKVSHSREYAPPKLQLDPQASKKQSDNSFSKNEGNKSEIEKLILSAKPFSVPKPSDVIVDKQFARLSPKLVSSNKELQDVVSTSNSIKLPTKNNAIVREVETADQAVIKMSESSSHDKGQTPLTDQDKFGCHRDPDLFFIDKRPSTLGNIKLEETPVKASSSGTPLKCPQSIPRTSSVDTHHHIQVSEHALQCSKTSNASLAPSVVENLQSSNVREPPETDADNQIDQHEVGCRRDLDKKPSTSDIKQEEVPVQVSRWEYTKPGGTPLQCPQSIPQPRSAETHQYLQGPEPLVRCVETANAVCAPSAVDNFQSSPVSEPLKTHAVKEMTPVSVSTVKIKNAPGSDVRVPKEAVRVKRESLLEQSDDFTLYSDEMVFDAIQVKSFLPGNNAFDDWVSVHNGYADLYHHINPDQSDVDKVVKFILDQNIPVRYMNFVYSSFSRSTVCKENGIKECPSFLKGNFSKLGLFSEEALILKRWNYLMKKTNIEDPIKCFQDFSAFKRRKVSIKKRNLLGCYLGLDLPLVRFAGNIFERTKKSLLSH